MPDVADVVVVGAGPAGCLTAQRLEERGLAVTLLDAGPRLPAKTRAPEVDRRIWPFSVEGDGFDWYRVRAVGGRAHLWGSWSHRFPDNVFRRGGWPFGRRALDRHYAAAEAQIGLKRGVLSPRFEAVATALELTMVPKAGARLRGGAVWTPRLLPVARRARQHLPATRLEHSRGRVQAVVAWDLRRERPVTVPCRAAILAASPIETARLLLASALGPLGRDVGHGLVDHMVASYVLLEPTPAPRGADDLHASALVESFVNLDDQTARPYRGGFSIELAGPVPVSALGLERMVPGGEEERWSATQLHALGECFPHAGRFVTLDPSLTDATGSAAPRIHVAWTLEEEAMAEDMKQACAQLSDALAIPGSKLIKFADPQTAGAGHEAGTCAMGLEAPAPCTPQGRLRALTNVWVADASTMPTSGDRHPTLTVLAQALRAADDCGRRLGGR